MSLLSFIGLLLLYMNLKPLEGLFTCLLFGRQWILLVQRYFPFAFTNNFSFHRSVSAAISRCFLSGLTTVTSAAGEMVQKNKRRREKRVKEQCWEFSVFIGCTTGWEQVAEPFSFALLHKPDWSVYSWGGCGKSCLWSSISVLTL